MISYWDFLNIVYDYSPEVREMKKTLDNYSYDHPLLKHGGGMTAFDINSDIARWLIKYQKSGKANKKLINYILNEAKEEIEKVEKENLWEKSQEIKGIKVEKGFIYLIKSNNLYKIGKAKNPRERINGYKTQNPFGIELIFQKEVNNYSQTEKRLLEKFKDKQVKGEWFKLNKEDILWIKQNL